MIRQEFVFGDKLLNHAVKVFQMTCIVQIGRVAAHVVVYLTKRRAAHARFTVAQVNQQQYAVFDVFQLRRNSLAYVFHWRKRRDNQAQRRNNGFFLFAILPHGFHRQAVFAHRNAQVQCLTGFRNRFDGAVEFFVFAFVAARRHPVGGEFDITDVTDIDRSDVGNGFADAHSARSRRVK